MTGNLDAKKQNASYIVMPFGKDSPLCFQDLGKKKEAWQ